MNNRELRKLIELLEKYNDWTFCGRDSEILSLIENIKEMLKTN
jgi:hypothetical protein